MARLIGNTLTLVMGVGVGVTLLGVSLAWLTSLCEFPGRRWLDWALMLPFAIPAYVLAFVFVGLLDFAGPVQSLLREWFGTGLRLMSLHGDGQVSIFAKNNIVTTAAQMTAAGKLASLAGDHRGNEFAGACFDPSGRILFVNNYTPGITFAITGPWAKGNL